MPVGSSIGVEDGEVSFGARGHTVDIFGGVDGTEFLIGSVARLPGDQRAGERGAVEHLIHCPYSLGPFRVHFRLLVQLEYGISEYGNLQYKLLKRYGCAIA